MVPTFTCGFVRSNFCLAIAWLLPAPCHGHGGPDALFVCDLCSEYLKTVRSATGADRGLLPLRPGDDLLGDRLRNLVVRMELHRVRGATLGARTQVSRVAEHIGERDQRLDDVARPLLIHALHAPPA